MIPELDPNEYDPENELSDEQKEVIIAAIIAFESSRIKRLLISAAKEYIKGVNEAANDLGIKIKVSSYEQELTKYLEEYKSQLENGYTIIQGKKVEWLKNRTLKERQMIFNILSTGVKNGKSSEEIALVLQEYIDLQKGHALTIADNELKTIRIRASDRFYQANGKNKFIWELGDFPCSICEPLGGQIFTWDTVPYEQPVHLHCHCGKRFVD